MALFWLQHLKKHIEWLTTMENIVKEYLLVFFIYNRRSFAIFDFPITNFNVYCHANLDLFKFLTLKEISSRNE